MDTKRIYFNIWHTIIIIVIVVFSFVFSKQMTNIDESDKSEPVIMSANQKEQVYRKVNINDTAALAEQVKQVLIDRINIVSEPQILFQNNDIVTMQIDTYTVEVKVDTHKVSDKTTIQLLVQQGENALKEEILMPVEFVDTQSPIIELSAEQIDLYEDEIFEADKYVALISDNYDANPTYEIVNAIPTNGVKLKTGSYDIIYRCMDSSNNSSEAKLHVNVKAKWDKEVLISKNVSDSLLYRQIISLVGKPYVWGGKGPDEFDCSGIIMYVYKLNGILLQWNDIQYGTGTSIPIDPSYWKPKDVLSYMDSSNEIVHHALYLGDHKALHALSSGVSVIDIDTPLISVDGSYQTLVRVMRFTD